MGGLHFQKHSTEVYKERPGVPELGFSFPTVLFTGSPGVFKSSLMGALKHGSYVRGRISILFLSVTCYLLSVLSSLWQC